MHESNLGKMISNMSLNKIAKVSKAILEFVKSKRRRAQSKEMKLIRELYESVEYIKEENENNQKDYYIQGIFIQAECKILNKRIYPIYVVEREVTRYITSSS